MIEVVYSTIHSSYQFISENSLLTLLVRSNASCFTAESADANTVMTCMHLCAVPCTCVSLMVLSTVAATETYSFIILAYASNLRNKRIHMINLDTTTASYKRN